MPVFEHQHTARCEVVQRKGNEQTARVSPGQQYRLLRFSDRRAAPPLWELHTRGLLH